MKLITELRNAMFSLCLFFVAGVFVLVNAESAESESAVTELTILLQDFNTGTFLKRDGEWRAVAWQATVIPAADESK